MDTEQLMRRLVLAAETRGAAGIADWMQRESYRVCLCVKLTYC